MTSADFLHYLLILL